MYICIVYTHTGGERERMSGYYNHLVQEKVSFLLDMCVHVQIGQSANSTLDCNAYHHCTNVLNLSQ